MTPPTRDQIIEAREVLGFVGTPVRVSLSFGSVYAFVEVDAAEHAARLAKATRPILSVPVLAALSEIPHCMPTHWASLDDHTRQILSGAPLGLIERSGAMVKRVVRRPIRIGGALATGGWASASQRVGPMGTLCEVAVLTAQRPQPAGIPTLEAALYGLGLTYLNPRGGIELVQTPEPSLRVPGPYQWRLCEAIYAAACELMVR